jgi:hypothetical protein
MSITTTWTANPSVALPAVGRVLGMPGCASVGQDVVREHVTVIGARTQDAFPGNSAWRPPIC